jgi:hypothetical protein
MTASANKLLAGALLAGMGIVTGEATLLATAGSVGGNWLAEGLAGLWPALSGRSPDPLARAYAAAIRSAVDTLEQQYHRTVDPRSDRAAFRLVADCADAVAGAEFPPGVADVDTAQRALAASLTALLHGHDARQAAFLRERLLAACAVAFQRQLVQDEAAWREFNGVILRALAVQSSDIAAKMDRFFDVLQVWSDPVASRAQLQRIEAQLTQLAGRSAQPASMVFDNRGMRVRGNVYQAARNQYFGSAHAEGGGTANVTNVFGSPAPSPRGMPSSTASTAEPDQPSAPPAVSILFLAASPADLPRLRLDQEARRVDEGLRRGRLGERFRMDQHWAVRAADLLDTLLRHRPAVVHFAGHGDAQGQLYLESDAGRATPVAPDALARLLAAPGSVRCAVLNACWTDALADALLAVTACVVGMASDVGDAAAIAFAAGFYRALAEGESVAQAVAAGRAEAMAEGGEEAALAVQLRAAAGVDPAAVRFT